jgi:hypothetical protein
MGTTAFAECKMPFPAENIIFQADIQYLNPKIKADPYVFISIQGQTKKFVLDTGANHHTTWEAFIVPPGHRKQILHAANSSAKEEIAHVSIADLAGRASLQEMGFIKGGGAELAKEGIAGLISPQALAGKNPFLIDFKHGCFLVGRHFDMKAFNTYQLYPGRLTPNPYQAMIVPIQVKNKEILVDIDSGTQFTALLAPVINGFPLVHQSVATQTEGMLGTRDTKKSIARRVNLVLNRLPLTHFSVREIDKSADANGIKIMGRVGMDILKNFMLIADFDQNTFHLLQERDKVRRH